VERVFPMHGQRWCLLASSPAILPVPQGCYDSEWIATNWGWNSGEARTASQTPRSFVRVFQQRKAAGQDILGIRPRSKPFSFRTPKENSLRTEAF